MKKEAIMSKCYKGNKLVLGKTPDGKEIIFTEEQRRAHMHVTGVTRVGMSRFLQSLRQQDRDQRKLTKQGLLVIDPHRELHDGVLAHLAEDSELWKLPPKKKGGDHE
jgi:hypothetical protein